MDCEKDIYLITKIQMVVYKSVIGIGKAEYVIPELLFKFQSKTFQEEGDIVYIHP